MCTRGIGTQPQGQGCVPIMALVHPRIMPSPISSCTVGEVSFDDRVLSDQNECDMVPWYLITFITLLSTLLNKQDADQLSHHAALHGFKFWGQYR